jgi:hypothetical protein
MEEEIKEKIALRNKVYFANKKMFQSKNERQLEEYMFYVFMRVFCVLAVEILKGVIPYVIDEGVGVRGTHWVNRSRFLKGSCGLRENWP